MYYGIKTFSFNLSMFIIINMVMCLVSSSCYDFDVYHSLLSFIIFVDEVMIQCYFIALMIVQF